MSNLNFEKASSTWRKQNTFPTNATAATRHTHHRATRNGTPSTPPIPTEPIDRFIPVFNVVATFENSASLLSDNCSSSSSSNATRDRSTTPFAVHLAVPRLLSIQFLVIRYLETISRVVLRVYTTGHSLAGLSADPHTLLVQKQRVCVWGCCACGRNTRP